MADFDPDAYLEKKESTPFDPDVYLAKKEDPSKIESGVRGLAQGASLGFADEITGGLESLFSDKSYERARDESRAKYKAAKEVNPGTYTAGEIGGAVGTAFIPGVGTGGSIAKLAGMGAAMGGAAGLGASEARDAKGLVVDTAKGAGIGALGGAAAGGLSKAVPSIAAGLRSSADDRAASALGMTKALRKKLGDDRALKVGREALENKVVTAFASPRKMLERASALGDEAGETIGGTMQSLDDMGQKAFNPLDVASRVDSEIGNVYRNEPLFKGLSNQYENTLETILNRGDKPISFAEAQNLKKLLEQYGYKEGQAVPGRELAQRVAGVVREELETSVDKGAQSLSNAEMAKRYLDAKRSYGASKDMVKGLENRVAGEQGNQGGIMGGLFGLRDAGAKAMGAATGGPAGYVAGEAIASGVRAFGNQTAAVSADKVARFLMQSPKLAKLAKENSPAFRLLVNQMSQRMTPERAFSSVAESQPGELDRESSVPSQERVPEEEARRSFIKGN